MFVFVLVFVSALLHTDNCLSGNCLCVYNICCVIAATLIITIAFVCLQNLAGSNTYYSTPCEWTFNLFELGFWAKNCLWHQFEFSVVQGACMHLWPQWKNSHQRTRARTHTHTRKQTSKQHTTKPRRVSTAQRCPFLLRQIANTDTLRTQRLPIGWGFSAVVARQASYEQSHVHVCGKNAVARMKRVSLYCI